LSAAASEDHLTTSGTRGLAVRAAILAGLFFLEKIFLTHFVNQQGADAALAAGSRLWIAQHFGFRFIVAFIGALVMFALIRGRRHTPLASSVQFHARVHPAFIAAHLILIACLAWLSSLLFPRTPAPIPYEVVVCLWLACGAAAVVFALAATAPLPLWTKAARALGKIWIYSAVAATAAAVAIPLSDDLWWTTTAATFHVVEFLLVPLLPGLIVDPASRILGTQQFAVQIATYCSGLEGMGLILAFTIVWLWYSRKEYRFPRALLLIPLGMALMFMLNAVRIAVLVLIGNAGYPEVAEYGFHSQAGWIAFNAVAVGIAFWTRRSRWLTGSAVPLEGAQTDNPTATFLLPLLTILAAGMVSHALSGKFEWFYPLRVVAAIAVLVIYRHRLAALNWRWTWRGPLLGVGVFILWILAAHLLGPDLGAPQTLSTASPLLRWSWIACRVAGTVLTVPLAEELAYRGFLMRRLQSRDFDSLPYARVGWLALAASSVCFGAAHGSLWLPGSVAGFAYGWIAKRQGQLAESVTAHMTTNALVAAFALGSGNWTGF
jgi:exosortase E/protease (VPEID-CTERM system)